MPSTRQTTGQSRRPSTTLPEGTAPPQYKRGHVPMPAPLHGIYAGDTAEPGPPTQRLIRGRVTMIAADANINDTTEAELLHQAPSEVTYPDLSDFEAQQSDDDPGPPEPLIPMRRQSGDSTADLLQHIADVANEQAQATIGGRMADKQKRESSKTAFQWAMSELLSIPHSNDPSVLPFDRVKSQEEYALLYPTGQMRSNKRQPYDVQDMNAETELWRQLHEHMSAWRKERENYMRTVAEDQPTGVPADRSRSGNFADTRGLPTGGTYHSQDHHSQDRVLRPGETITTQHNGMHYHLRGPERR